MVPYRTRAMAVSRGVSRLSLEFSHLTCQPPTSSLRPINPDNACPLRITAAAGT